MALGPRLDIRQSQSLVMTPQLQQAIKLLALSNLEVETFIGEAIDANPLLELGEAAPAVVDPLDMPGDDGRRTQLESSPVDQLVSEGRAAEDRPLVFDRFFRSADARGRPGSGLGLAIVRDIAEAHGGSVFADGRPDGGVTVGFTLPARPA